MTISEPGFKQLIASLMISVREGKSAQEILMLFKNHEQTLIDRIQLALEQAGQLRLQRIESNIQSGELKARKNGFSRAAERIKLFKESKADFNRNA